MLDSERKPELIVIAGPNGSLGKMYVNEVPEWARHIWLARLKPYGFVGTIW